MISHVGQCKSILCIFTPGVFILVYDCVFSPAKAWEQTKLIKNFINEVESQTQEMSKETETVKEWFKWARQKVEEYDPLNKNKKSRKH